MDMDQDFKADLLVVVVECQKRDGQTHRQHNYIYRLRVLRNMRLKLISRLGKVNLFKVLDLLTESHLQRGF